MSRKPDKCKDRQSNESQSDDGGQCEARQDEFLHIRVLSVKSRRGELTYLFWCLLNGNGTVHACLHEKTKVLALLL